MPRQPPRPAALHRHHSPQTNCRVPPLMLLPTKPFRSSQSLPNLPALCSQLTPRGAGSAGDAAARTARLPAPSCPQGAGHRALFSSFRSGRADPVTFPLPALSQRKPGQGGFATGASPAAYQGKRLGNPRAAAGSTARPGAAGPGHGQVPAELRGKGRGWDLRAWVREERDQVNRQTMHCFPPALSALWDHELRSLRSLGTQLSLRMGGCGTAGSSSKCGRRDSPSWVLALCAPMVQASHKDSPSSFPSHPNQHQSPTGSGSLKKEPSAWCT